MPAASCSGRSETTGRRSSTRSSRSTCGRRSRWPGRSCRPCAALGPGHASSRVGSVADHVGFPENAAYAASKYGLRGLHETLAAGVPRHRRAAHPGVSRADRHRRLGPVRSRPPARVSPAGPGCCGPADVAERCSSSPPARLTCSSTGCGSARSDTLTTMSPIHASGSHVLTSSCRLIRRDPASSAAGPALRAQAGTTQARQAAAAAARQRRLGRARPRRRARSQGASGSEPTARASTVCRRATAPGSPSATTPPADARSRWTSCRPSRFGPRGEIWYGTVGNGWGLSIDGGRTWRNWTYDQLGPEWQYVAPAGIAVRGDTTVIGDGRRPPDHHRRRRALDRDRRRHRSAGAGPGRHGAPAAGERVRAPAGGRPRGWNVTTLRGQPAAPAHRRPAGWREPLAAAAFPPANALADRAAAVSGARRCGLRPAADTLPCLRQRRRTPSAPASRSPSGSAGRSRRPTTPTSTRPTVTARPWAGTSSSTRASSSTIPTARRCMAGAGGQGGVRRPGGAGGAHGRHPARHHGDAPTARRYRSTPSTTTTPSLEVKVGQRVDRAGDLPSRQHRPRHQRPPAPRARRLAHRFARARSWTRCSDFRPTPPIPSSGSSRCPDTGIVAGQVFDGAGAPVPQARIYGIVKREPVETPFSYAETYGDKAHSHPLYGEHFAVSDVPGGYLHRRAPRSRARRCSARSRWRRGS